ncbi:MAG: MlaD family protein [Polyangiaceae bacterium]|jgi:phospholipid/cholesterol/gamma-HCH transport system substrate-binding protein
MTRELKVGLFVILGLTLTMMAVFLIGDTTRLWDTKAAYRAAFRDVGGLKPGAPVRMGGLDIGTVTSVGYDANPGDTRIFVKISVVKAQSVRIRRDSVATVGNKGLLGDKMIEISVGSPDAALLDSTELIPTREPADVFAAAGKIVTTAQEAIQHLEPLARSLGDPKLADDLRGSADDIRALLDALVRRDSTMNRLFFDARQGEQVSELIGHIDQSSARLDAVLSDVQDVAERVRQGPGIAHALVYDGEISRQVAGSFAELDQDLRAIREGNGLAHALLFGDTSSQHVMSNVNAMSDDLRAIVGGLRDGKGTLGALLVDPTVYEDLKAAIGNVERNEVLRAFVRYSIKADEKQR